MRLPRMVLLIGGLMVLGTLTGCPGSKARVVLYCAQDREFAEETLADFTKSQGIDVATHFDTEADKSVSLYNRLLQEKARPRCDVFWNNEILSTLRLQRLDMLEAYDSPAAKPYPDFAKAKDHTWHAFAGRARVLVVSTKLVKPSDMPKSLLDLVDPKWKGRVAMARPQFGTTATQAACLFEVMGKEAAIKYYRDLKGNGVQLAPGNKQVAEWVGAGATPGGQPVALGVTDTDDAMEEMEAHPHVTMIFPDRDRPKDDRMGVLFIPNSVGIIKGGPNPQAARKLVDFLLSAEVEKRLAEGPSKQIPINPEVKVKLPEAMVTPAQVKVMDVDFGKAADLWDEVQTFVRNEFARP